MFLLLTLNIFYTFWTPGFWRKGPIKSGPSVRPSIIRSFRPSFRLSVSLLRIGSLVFSETWHGVREPYILLCDRAGFFWKNPDRAKMTKNAQKWPKNRVFELFKKIMVLVLSGICVKRKFLWFINILWKLHAWEKSGSQVIAKNGSWPMRFQYSLIVNISLISDFDFWHVDRHESKKQGLLTGFLKKFTFGQMGHFGSKNCASS